MPAQHRSPSRVRYAATHPTIGIHVDSATWDRLHALREKTGLSYAQLIVPLLADLEVRVDTARSRGWKEGHEEGAEEGYAEGYRDGHQEGLEDGDHAGYMKGIGEFRIIYPCISCGAAIDVRPGSPEAEAAAAWLRDDGWRHAECPPA